MSRFHGGGHDYLTGSRDSAADGEMTGSRDYFYISRPPPAAYWTDNLLNASGGLGCRKYTANLTIMREGTAEPPAMNFAKRFASPGNLDFKTKDGPFEARKYTINVTKGQSR